MLLLAMDSEAQTEYIYAQILQEELQRVAGPGTINTSRFNPLSGARGGGATSVSEGFNPLAVRRQPLIDFLRLQPYERIVMIGSAELQTLQFPVYHRPSGKWGLFSRKELETLAQTEHTDPQ